MTVFIYELFEDGEPGVLSGRFEARCRTANPRSVDGELEVVLTWARGLSDEVVVTMDEVAYNAGAVRSPEASQDWPLDVPRIPRRFYYEAAGSTRYTRYWVKYRFQSKWWRAKAASALRLEGEHVRNITADAPFDMEYLVVATATRSADTSGLEAVVSAMSSAPGDSVVSAPAGEDSMVSFVAVVAPDLTSGQPWLND